MTNILYFSFWLLLQLSNALAQVQVLSPPGQSEISYSVNIPQTTSNSGSGPIFIQIKSTKQLEWLAFGQGVMMQGANIFIVYGSGNNVTVSPRLGKQEHVEPLYNPQARISVLDGSGIHDGVMTANIRCESCVSWPGGHEDVTSSSSPWIWAVKNGPFLDSEDTSEELPMHNFYGTATLNLKQATGGNSDNPFLGDSGTSTTAQAGTTVDYQSVSRKRIAHAVIMILSFVVLFPLFALVVPAVPSPRTVDIHACLQLFTLALTVAGLGIGISMAKDLQLIGFYHPIIGITTVSCLILFQPAMGLAQHLYFRRTGMKSIASYLHRWFGRTFITLGMINAGLGFRLAGVGLSFAPVGAVIAYSVIAGLVCISYALAVSWLFCRKR
ncbi:cytochrome and DOMON domain-containing protein [Aspergillus puulaauensis]|uniref:Cellobiose dehydrogenase n=1 Tax=Aspergillus puulaauensis TaxID=1220207 RepID=A0A7R7XSJ3_9EURO|nr:uncharacterized protein APUU_60025S [Aspergillus puulaauensis]BCS26977.1 hypothetical protein APUU_60025S [Aspergillus puulaauensis]